MANNKTADTAITEISPMGCKNKKRRLDIKAPFKY